MLVLVFSVLFSLHFKRYWLGEFVKKSGTSQIGDHFRYSHDLNMWFRGDIVRRNKMLVTLKGQRVQELLHLVIISVILITFTCDSRGYCEEKLNASKIPNSCSLQSLKNIVFSPKFSPWNFLNLYVNNFSSFFNGISFKEGFVYEFT